MGTNQNYIEEYCLLECNTLQSGRSSPENFCWTTKCYIPEDCGILHSPCCASLKSNTVKFTQQLLLQFPQYKILVKLILCFLSSNIQTVDRHDISCKHLYQLLFTKTRNNYYFGWVDGNFDHSEKYYAYDHYKSNCTWSYKHHIKEMVPIH